jgi:2-(1,2-epoxy-1,2-dihydrophenyl)acetyl-CoA isomerase
VGSTEHVRYELADHVATVTLDRPAQKNACTMDMWLAIRDAFRDIPTTNARVAILTGANGDFCAGADLGSSLGGATKSGFDRGGLAGMRDLAGVVAAVHDCSVPVIAKVDGVAIGAGFGLALAADLLWCSERARFSLAFARLGLSLDFATSWVLPRRIGLHQAKRLAFTGEIVTAERASALGFVNEVVPVDELDAAVDAIARQIAAGPPIALSMTKRMLDNAVTSTLTQSLEAEAVAQAVNLGTTDLPEGLQAFAEKRPPAFQGR